MTLCGLTGKLVVLICPHIGLSSFHCRRTRKALSITSGSEPFEASTELSSSVATSNHDYQANDSAYQVPVDSIQESLRGKQRMTGRRHTFENHHISTASDTYSIPFTGRSTAKVNVYEEIKGSKQRALTGPPVINTNTLQQVNGLHVEPFLSQDSQPQPYQVPSRPLTPQPGHAAISLSLDSQPQPYQVPSRPVTPLTNRSIKSTGSHDKLQSDASSLSLTEAQPYEVPSLTGTPVHSRRHYTAPSSAPTPPPPPLPPHYSSLVNAAEKCEVPFSKASKEQPQASTNTLKKQSPDEKRTTVDHIYSTLDEGITGSHAKRNREEGKRRKGEGTFDGTNSTMPVYAEVRK